MRTKLLYIISLVLLLSACKSTKKVGVKKLANKKNLPILLERVEQNEFKPDWMYLKASLDFEKGETETGFKANIRMRRDSMIWISITPLMGVELARVALTPDSVKVVNRLEGTYFVGDYEYLNKTFDTEVNYPLIQALLLGNSLSLEENEKLVASIDNGMYFLSGLKRRKLRKSLEKDDVKTPSDKVFSAWIDPITFKITKQSFVDFESDHFLEVNYLMFKEIEDNLFPHKTSITLEAEEKVITEISYSGVYINKPKKMPFSISSKYEPIEF